MSDEPAQIEQIDNWKEHERHVLDPQPATCSSCFKRKIMEDEVKVEHKNCGYCKGTLTHYVQDGDSVQNEICPDIPNEVVTKLYSSAL